MIDSHISPSLELWLIITTATHSNTEFHIPSYIPNRSELYDTVRKTYQQIMKWKNTWVCLNRWKHVWHELNEFPWRLSLHSHWSDSPDHSLLFICPQKHRRKGHFCVISPTAWPFSSADTELIHNMCGYSLLNPISYRDRSIWKRSKSFLKS